ncbi:unnamed protein product, partial [Didymodactylos carnosus]
MTETKSVISESSSSEHPPGLSDDADDLDLYQRLEKIEREIVELTFENRVFETNLERKKSEPVPTSNALGVSAAGSSLTSTPTGSTQDVSGGGRGDRLARKRSKSRSTQGDFRVQLTLEQKLDIIVSEYEQMKNDKQKKEMSNEKKLDQLESDLEWIDVEAVDFEAAITEFLKLKETSIDKRTKKYIGEKIDRYFNERKKARESLINKLTDKSQGLKRLIKRLESQLRQKEEMGETLHEVDFNQLKIENKQYLDKIDEKNYELIVLKRQVGQATQQLNRYKDELQTELSLQLDIHSKIDKQQQLLERVDQEMSQVNQELAKADKLNQTLTEQTQDYQVPEVLDYVKKKALLYNLQRDVSVWERKLEIAQMALQQSKQQWQTLQRTAQFQNQPSQAVGGRRE